MPIYEAAGLLLQGLRPVEAKLSVHDRPVPVDPERDGHPLDPVICGHIFGCHEEALCEFLFFGELGDRFGGFVPCLDGQDDEAIFPILLSEP